MENSFFINYIMSFKELIYLKTNLEEILEISGG